MLCATHFLIVKPCFLCAYSYLPFDNCLFLGHLEFQEALDELEGFIDSQDDDIIIYMLAVVGDFSVDSS